MGLPRPCLEQGCPNVTTNGPRCPTHKAAKNRKRDQARGPRPWYQDPTYRATRKAYNLTGATCWRCGTWLPPGQVTVDHHPPVKEADDWKTCDLLPACATCNSAHGGTLSH